MLKAKDIKSGMIFQPKGRRSLYIVISTRLRIHGVAAAWCVAWLNRSMDGAGIDMAYGATSTIMDTDTIIGWIGEDKQVGYWDRSVSEGLINELTDTEEWEVVA